MQLYGRAGLWTDYQAYCAEARNLEKKPQKKLRNVEKKLKNFS